MAGGDGRLQWTEDAAQLIHEAAAGVPRLINNYCDRSLLAGYLCETFTIEAALVQQAIADTELRVPAEPVAS